MMKAAVALLVSVAAVLPLSGCGGGGGGGHPNPTPTPTPTPTPSPTPTPTPTPGITADAEYQNSPYLGAANALVAYQAGATGAGTKIAIIDNGIDGSSAEFAGRIDPASTGTTATDGHGTAVAQIAAGARNGVGSMGVAFGATILAYNTWTCTQNDCFHPLAAVASAIDTSVANGARVINLSMVGANSSSAVATAIQNATQAGVVVVIAAGNDGAASPDGFALQNAAATTSGLIIAGAHDGGGAIISSQAGEGATWYLAAYGGSTSASTPVISGAVALLAQAFPNLTGAQIVQLLFNSATDAGAAGVDPLYGHGLLNIGRAFQPQGTLTLAGTKLAITASGNGSLSGAMGDATAGLGSGAIILDGYARAYALDLIRTLQRAPADRPLSSGLAAGYRSAVMDGKNLAVLISFTNGPAGMAGRPAATAFQLSRDEAVRGRAIAAMVVDRISPKTSVAFGMSHSAQTLARQLASQRDFPFLVANLPAARTGLQVTRSNSMGLRHEFGPAAVTLFAEAGKTFDPRRPSRAGDSSYSTAGFMADRRLGPVTVSVGGSTLHEDATVLGGRLSGLLSVGGSATRFVDAAAAWELGSGWRISSTYRQGRTSVRSMGGLVSGGKLSSNSFSVDVAKAEAFREDDEIAFRITQPIRVTGGGLRARLPTAYDYSTGQADFSDRVLNLAPKGREMDYEVAYWRPFGSGNVDLNGYIRTDPGHISGAAADVGAAVRMSFPLR